MLPNISRSKRNQIMKFGPLMEYNMRNILLKNHTQNMVGKLPRESFIKIKFERISESTVSNFIQFVFIVCRSGDLAKYIKVLTTCFDLV